jgi:hypothetical protein
MPDTWPKTMTVDTLTLKGWETIYHSVDASKRTLRGPLRFRRVRGVHDAATTAAKVRANFVDWVARETFSRHPGAQKVRIRVIQSQTAPPGQPNPGHSQTSMNEIRTRQQVTP